MPEWGRAIGEKAIGTYRVKIYEPRPQTMLSFLQESAKFGDREFLVFDERRISFSRFITATESAAARFAAAGIRSRDAMLLNGAKSPESILAVWPLIRVGEVVSRANASW